MKQGDEEYLILLGLKIHFEQLQASVKNSYEDIKKEISEINRRLDKLQSPKRINENMPKREGVLQ